VDPLIQVVVRALVEEYTSDRLDQVLGPKSSCWPGEMYRTRYRGKLLVNGGPLQGCTDRLQVEQAHMASRRCFARVQLSQEKINPEMMARYVVLGEKANLERMGYMGPMWVEHFGS